MRFIILAILMLVTVTTEKAYAHDFKVDGVCYNIIGDEVEVTYEGPAVGSEDFYKGDVIIPSQVTYEGKKYDVTSIGHAAFRYCYELNSVILPESLEAIGFYAFEQCSALKSIVIPNSVTYIGYVAFARCSSLETVEMSNSLEILDTYAFGWCNSLKTIDLPATLSVMYIEAFCYCTSLQSINVSEGNETFTSVDGVVYTADKSEIFVVPGGKSGKFIIPQTVTSLYRGAFVGCNYITSVEIPNSVKYIGEEEFSDCESLEAINVAEGNEQYASEDGVLFNKKKTRLVKYPNHKQGDYQIPGYVNSIGDFAFEMNNSLISISIPDNVNDIGFGAFSLSKVKTVELPNTIPFIAPFAFQCSTNLTSINLPNTITEIGESAFMLCTSLDSIIIPNSVIAIDKFAFSDCSSLKEIELPNSITEIRDGVFRWCAFSSIKLPNSILSIGEEAFKYCLNLESIDIPESVESIGPFAFAESQSLKSIVIPNSVKTLGEQAFCNGFKLESIIISNSITQIERYTFGGNPSLTYVEIPNSVKTIGETAFLECRSLSEINIPNSVITIGDQAFMYCENLTSIVIPNSVTSIGREAFCTSPLTTHVEISESVESIGDRAFFDANSLEDVLVLAKEPPSLGDEAFSDELKGRRSVLHVPEGALNAYRDSEWSLYFDIFVDDATGIESVENDSDEHPEYINIKGMRANAETLTPGLYIRRLGSKSEKVLVK